MTKINTCIKCSQEIFRKSDIRGIVGKHLTSDTVEIIGKGIGTFMKRRGAKVITVGYDARISSFDFRNAIVDSILSTGCDLIDISMVPTPVAYFSLHFLGVDGGVMITGSHNPSEYNGFKISFGTFSLFGDDIQEIYRLINNDDFETGRGRLYKRDIIDDYIDKIISLITLENPVKFVVDGGNGCFGVVGHKLFEKLGLKPQELYWKPDGNFPHHHPDPTIPENMLDLSAKVQSENAQLGIGFDGDVDRIGVVDENGRMVWGDQLLMLFSRNILSKNPGATIVGDVKCSQILFDDIKKHGGIPEISPSGHSIVKNIMMETNALLGGEMSGHILFMDNYYGYDDAIFAACRLLEIVSASDLKLSEMIVSETVTVNTPVIQLSCPDDIKFRIVDEIGEFFKGKYNILDVDGIRLNCKDGWALIRASNTQPALTLRFEANSAEKLNELKKIVYEPISQYEVIHQMNELTLSNLLIEDH